MSAFRRSHDGTLNGEEAVARRVHEMYRLA